MIKAASGLNERLRSILLKSLLKYTTRRNYHFLDQSNFKNKRTFGAYLLNSYGEGKFFIVKSAEDKNITGHWHDGVSRILSESETSMSYSEASQLLLEVHEFLTPIQVTYRGTSRAFWGIISLKSLRERTSYRFKIWATSIQKITRDDRISFLSWCYKETIEHKHSQYEFTIFEYINHKHGLIIYSHPKINTYIRHYSFLAESLENTGDLEKTRTSYFKVKPQAIITLDNYAEAEQRHKDNKNLQKIICILTALLFLVGCSQAFIAYKAWKASSTAQAVEENREL